MDDESNNRKVKFQDNSNSNRKASTNQVMKTSKRGRPFMKDTHDLFSTLMVSLNLKNHRNLFRSYQNSFTTDEACTNLNNLKFSQSVRIPDPNDNSKIVTTTSTTTFSMDRHMAKGICQIFIDAHLIENATDPSSNAFKDRGIYLITPKGLHILERFITKNGISGEHLIHVFSTQPICLKLLHLERRPSDDEILVNKQIIQILFKRFVGRQPNCLDTQSSSSSLNSPKQSLEFDRSNGIILNPINNSKISPVSSDLVDIHHTFVSNNALDWLLDFTTISGKDEAAEICGHFVRYGLIKLVNEKAIRDDDLVVTVNYSNHKDEVQECEFRASHRCVYGITALGRRSALWDIGSDNASLDSLERSSSSRHRDSNLSRQQSKGAGQLQHDFNNQRTRDAAVNVASAHHKESNTGRLKQILDDPALRSLFREFLRSNFCEENLSFWLDVQDFKRRFSTTSSAIAKPQQYSIFSSKNQSKNNEIKQSAMQQHQQDINTMACVIYNTYLAPSSSSELNIDHSLRADLVDYMSNIKMEAKERYGTEIKPENEDDIGIGQIPLQASQLSKLIILYEKIQAYIFRLMATDSVPKFVKTERFLSLMSTFEEYNNSLDVPPVPPIPNNIPGNPHHNKSIDDDNVSHHSSSIRSSINSHSNSQNHSLRAEPLAATTSNSSIRSKKSSLKE